MRDQDFLLELDNLWKRCWLPAIVALAVILGVGILFMSLLCTYTRTHSAYMSTASIISFQVEFK